MKGLLYVARAAGALAVVGLALVAPQASAVIGGTADSTHTNVGIIYPDDRPALLAGFCSGSLIAPHEFLTAGHCTAAYLPSRVGHIRVTFDAGPLPLSPEGVITPVHSVAVSGWTTDPDYSGGKDDVGVVHLAEDVNVAPVELPDVGFLDQKADAGELRDHTFLLVGYGLNGTQGNYFNMQAPIWDHQRESGPLQFQSLASDNLHTKGVGCGGDSGGPAFYTADSDLVVGTDSYGASSCGEPDVYQRLDTQSVHDFLAEFTQP